MASIAAPFVNQALGCKYFQNVVTKGLSLVWKPDTAVKITQAVLPQHIATQERVMVIQQNLGKVTVSICHKILKI